MNAAANKEQDHRGTGIGVHNIEIMMEQMQGRCEEECGEESYRICLYFHLKNQKIHKETFTFSLIFRQRCLRENRLVMKKTARTGATACTQIRVQVVAFHTMKFNSNL